MKKDKVPFYKRPLIIILLFIFLPPIGIPLLFLSLKRPSRKIKIIISIVWAILWVIIIAASQVKSTREYSVNNRSVTISCSTYCSYIDDYGDKDALKILATIGIKKVKTASYSLKDTKADLIVESSSPDAIKLTLEYLNEKVSRIYNTTYPSIIYYSATSTDKVVAYPASDNIKALKDAKQKENAAKKQAEEAAKAQQAQAEADRVAADAKVPSSEGTVELCEKYFHQQYPYNGSEVHSLLGVITNSPNGVDTRLYKVEVTVQNGFGAKYDAVMECVVKKTGDTITIDTFNVYR